MHLVSDEIYALSCFGPSFHDGAEEETADMQANNEEMERQVAQFDLAQCQGGLVMQREQVTESPWGSGFQFAFCAERESQGFVYAPL